MICQGSFFALINYPGIYGRKCSGFGYPYDLNSAVMSSCPFFNASGRESAPLITFFATSHRMASIRLRGMISDFLLYGPSLFWQ